MLLALFALGFNLLLGYTGSLSFGEAGFFATGAYVCALILLQTPSLLVGLLGVVVAAGVIALVLGYLSVRLPASSLSSCIGSGATAPSSAGARGFRWQPELCLPAL